MKTNILYDQKYYLNDLSDLCCGVIEHQINVSDKIMSLCTEYHLNGANMPIETKNYLLDYFNK